MRTFVPELLRAVRMLAMGTLGIFAAVPGPPKDPLTAVGLDAGVIVPPPKASLLGATRAPRGPPDILPMVFGLMGAALARSS